MIWDSGMSDNNGLLYRFEHWLAKNEKFEEIKENYLNNFFKKII